MMMRIRTRLAGLASIALLAGGVVLGPAAPARAAVTYQPIFNLALHQCIDTPRRQLNELLRLANCNGSDTQQWAILPAGAPGTYTFINKATNLCMEVNEGTSIPGELVDAWLCDGLSSEQWVRIPSPIGLQFELFQHAGTGLCLDTVSGVNSNLMQWYCGPTNDMQTWHVGLLNGGGGA